ncbi:hypothetical protein D3C72_2148440 [compost metagenome]
MPGVCAITCAIVFKPWSCMRCCVMTLTDCGVSLIDRPSGVAVAIGRVETYAPEPSVASCCALTDTSGIIAIASPPAAASAGRST